MSLWTVPVLVYHRVGDAREDHVPTVSTETFERHLRFIERGRYRVLRLEELAELLQAGTRMPRRTVVVTFDDGYEETFQVAAPILRRFGFPATVFVTPTEVGLPGFMTWDQLRHLARDGMSIGSHTLHHTYLPLVAEARAEQELVDSKRTLEQQLGQPVHVLSYPVGGFTPAIQRLAQAAGYRTACTTNRSLSKWAPQDLFAVRRIKMTERDRHAPLLWAKLSGYYDCFRRLERPS